MDTIEFPLLTRHAAIRARQRGVSRAVLDTLLLHADIDSPAGRGCRSLQLSVPVASTLIGDGELLKTIEAALRTTLIVDEADRIVTVIRRPPSTSLRLLRRARRPVGYF